MRKLLLVSVFLVGCGDRGRNDSDDAEGIVSNKEPTAKKSAPKKIVDARGHDTVSFKEFADFPERYIGGRRRVIGVLLHGDLTRIVDSDTFSATVSSADDRWVHSRDQTTSSSGSDPVFILATPVGKSLRAKLDNNRTYASNIYFEVARIDGVHLAYVHRVELIDEEGETKEVFSSDRDR